MLIHILKIIKNNLRANLLLVAGIFVIATSLWYAVDYVYAVAVNGQKSLDDWDSLVDMLKQQGTERLEELYNTGLNQLADRQGFQILHSRHYVIHL